MIQAARPVVIALAVFALAGPAVTRMSVEQGPVSIALAREEGPR